MLHPKSLPDSLALDEPKFPCLYKLPFLVFCLCWDVTLRKISSHWRHDVASLELCGNSTLPSKEIGLPGKFPFLPSFSHLKGSFPAYFSPRRYSDQFVPAQSNIPSSFISSSSRQKENLRVSVEIFLLTLLNFLSVKWNLPNCAVAQRNVRIS